MCAKQRNLRVKIPCDFEDQGFLLMYKDLISRLFFLHIFFYTLYKYNLTPLYIFGEPVCNLRSFLMMLSFDLEKLLCESSFNQDQLFWCYCCCCYCVTGPFSQFGFATYHQHQQQLWQKQHKRGINWMKKCNLYLIKSNISCTLS